MEVEAYNSFKYDMEEITLDSFNQMKQQLVLLGSQIFNLEERIKKLEKE